MREEKLVLADGYTVNGKQIERETIVDSTLIKNVKKHQTVRMYEDFKIARPEIRVDSTDGMTGESAMEKILLAAENAKKWAEDVFGKTKYVTDKKGNVVSSTVSRKISKKDFENNGMQVAEELVENYKVSAEKYKESEDKQSENIKRLSELEEKIKSKGYNELSDSEKEEYGNLTGEITELSDGAINEWIGYAPTFKSPSELDYNASAESNVMYKGMGQMGIIMLDFQWNSMVEGNGFKELAKPMYDKKMWDDNGSWFEPPTFRDVMDIALEVVGNATGQKWVGWLDDALFATTDLTGGYKSAEEVGLALGKKALTTVVSAGMGAASNYLGDLAGEALQGASKFANFAAQSGISMGTNYVTSVANSAVNSFYIGENGLAFNTDGFTKSLYSADTISGAIGAGITGGLNATTIGYNNQYVNGFNSQQIDLIQTFNTSHASANTIDQYFSLFGQSGINMDYNNGTYLLTGLQAGTVIGYMGNTGANTTGACFTLCRIYNAFALRDM